MFAPHVRQHFETISAFRLLLHPLSHQISSFMTHYIHGEASRQICNTVLLPMLSPERSCLRFASLCVEASGSAASFHLFSFHLFNSSMVRRFNISSFHHFNSSTVRRFDGSTARYFITSLFQSFPHSISSIHTEHSPVAKATDISIGICIGSLCSMELWSNRERHHGGRLR